MPLHGRELHDETARLELAGANPGILAGLPESRGPRRIARIWGPLAVSLARLPILPAMVDLNSAARTVAITSYEQVAGIGWDLTQLQLRGGFPMGLVETSGVRHVIHGRRPRNLRASAPAWCPGPALPATFGHLGGADVLGDQLVDRHVPLHQADGDRGRLLARVELHDAAGAVVAEPGDDDAVAGLEPGAGLGDPRVVLGLALEVGEPLVQGLAAPLGLGLRGEGATAGRPRPPCGASGRSPARGLLAPRPCSR